MDILLIYLAAGAVAGLIAGLFGVGGGLIIVPVLVYVFSTQGLNAELIVHMAIGTSLATIVFTSLSSVRAHHKRGAVRWDLFWQLTPSIVIGALLGSIVADWMPAAVLSRFFAVFEWLVAIQLLLNFRPKPSRTVPGKLGMAAVGNSIGALSSIVGVGGGTMTVPFLVWCNVAVHQAVGTSSACGIPIAVAGAVGFVVMGWEASQPVAWSLGYLYLPAFLGVVAASVLFAPVGAWVAHRLPGDKLKRLFGLFLFALGVYMFLHA